MPRDHLAFAITEFRKRASIHGAATVLAVVANGIIDGRIQPQDAANVLVDVSIYLERARTEIHVHTA